MPPPTKPVPVAPAPPPAEPAPVAPVPPPSEAEPAAVAPGPAAGEPEQTEAEAKAEARKQKAAAAAEKRQQKAAAAEEKKQQKNAARNAKPMDQRYTSHDVQFLFGDSENLKSVRPFIKEFLQEREAWRRDQSLSLSDYHEPPLPQKDIEKLAKTVIAYENDEQYVTARIFHDLELQGLQFAKIIPVPDHQKQKNLEGIVNRTIAEYLLSKGRRSLKKLLDRLWDTDGSFELKKKSHKRLLKPKMFLSKKDNDKLELKLSEKEAALKRKADHLQAEIDQVSRQIGELEKAVLKQTKSSSGSPEEKKEIEELQNEIKDLTAKLKNLKPLRDAAQLAFIKRLGKRKIDPQAEAAVQEAADKQKKKAGVDFDGDRSDSDEEEEEDAGVDGVRGKSIEAKLHELPPCCQWFRKRLRSMRQMGIAKEHWSQCEAQYDALLAFTQERASEQQTLEDKAVIHAKAATYIATDGIDCSNATEEFAAILGGSSETKVKLDERRLNLETNEALRILKRGLNIEDNLIPATATACQPILRDSLAKWTTPALTRQQNAFYTASTLNAVVLEALHLADAIDSGFNLQQYKSTAVAGKAAVGRQRKPLPQLVSDWHRAAHKDGAEIDRDLVDLIAMRLSDAGSVRLLERIPLGFYFCKDAEVADVPAWKGVVSDLFACINNPLLPRPIFNGAPSLTKGLIKLGKSIKHEEQRQFAAVALKHTGVLPFQVNTSVVREQWAQSKKNNPSFAWLKGDAEFDVQLPENDDWFPDVPIDAETTTKLRALFKSLERPFVARWREEKNKSRPLAEQIAKETVFAEHLVRASAPYQMQNEAEDGKFVSRLEAPADRVKHIQSMLDWNRDLFDTGIWDDSSFGDCFLEIPSERENYEEEEEADSSEDEEEEVLYDWADPAQREQAKKFAESIELDEKAQKKLRRGVPGPFDNVDENESNEDEDDDYEDSEEEDSDGDDSETEIADEVPDDYDGSSDGGAENAENEEDESGEEEEEEDEEEEDESGEEEEEEEEESKGAGSLAKKQRAAPSQPQPKRSGGTKDSKAPAKKQRVGPEEDVDMEQSERTGDKRKAAPVQRTVADAIREEQNNNPKPNNTKKQKKKPSDEEEKKEKKEKKPTEKHFVEDAGCASWFNDRLRSIRQIGVPPKHWKDFEKQYDELVAKVWELTEEEENDETRAKINAAAAAYISEPTMDCKRAPEEFAEYYEYMFNGDDKHKGKFKHLAGRYRLELTECKAFGDYNTNGSTLIEASAFACTPFVLDVDEDLIEEGRNAQLEAMKSEHRLSDVIAEAMELVKALSNGTATKTYKQRCTDGRARVAAKRTQNGAKGYAATYEAWIGPHKDEDGDWTHELEIMRSRLVEIGVKNWPTKYPIGCYFAIPDKPSRGFVDWAKGKYKLSMAIYPCSAWNGRETLWQKLEATKEISENQRDTFRWFLAIAARHAKTPPTNSSLSVMLDALNSIDVDHNPQFAWLAPDYSIAKPPSDVDPVLVSWTDDERDAAEKFSIQAEEKAREAFLKANGNDDELPRLVAQEITHYKQGEQVPTSIEDLTTTKPDEKLIGDIHALLRWHLPYLPDKAISFALEFVKNYAAPSSPAPTASLPLPHQSSSPVTTASSPPPSSPAPKGSLPLPSSPPPKPSPSTPPATPSPAPATPLPLPFTTSATPPLPPRATASPATAAPPSENAPAPTTPAPVPTPPEPTTPTPPSVPVAPPPATPAPATALPLPPSPPPKTPTTPAAPTPQSTTVVVFSPQNNKRPRENDTSDQKTLVVAPAKKQKMTVSYSRSFGPRLFIGLHERSLRTRGDGLDALLMAHWMAACGELAEPLPFNLRTRELFVKARPAFNATSYMLCCTLAKRGDWKRVLWDRNCIDVLIGGDVSTDELDGTGLFTKLHEVYEASQSASVEYVLLMFKDIAGKEAAEAFLTEINAIQAAPAPMDADEPALVVTISPATDATPSPSPVLPTTPAPSAASPVPPPVPPAAPFASATSPVPPTPPATDATRSPPPVTPTTPPTTAAPAVALPPSDASSSPTVATSEPSEAPSSPSTDAPRPPDAQNVSESPIRKLYTDWKNMFKTSRPAANRCLAAALQGLDPSNRFDAEAFFEHKQGERKDENAGHGLQTVLDVIKTATEAPQSNGDLSNTLVRFLDNGTNPDLLVYGIRLAFDGYKGARLELLKNALRKPYPEWQWCMDEVYVLLSRTLLSNKDLLGPDATQGAGKLDIDLCIGMGPLAEAERRLAKTGLTPNLARALSDWYLQKITRCQFTTNLVSQARRMAALGNSPQDDFLAQLQQLKEAKGTGVKQLNLFFETNGTEGWPWQEALQAKESAPMFNRIHHYEKLFWLELNKESGKPTDILTKAWTECGIVLKPAQLITFYARRKRTPNTDSADFARDLIALGEPVARERALRRIVRLLSKPDFDPTQIFPTVLGAYKTKAGIRVVAEDNPKVAIDALKGLTSNNALRALMSNNGDPKVLLREAASSFQKAEEKDDEKQEDPLVDAFQKGKALADKQILKEMGAILQKQSMTQDEKTNQAFALGQQRLVVTGGTLPPDNQQALTTLKALVASPVQIQSTPSPSRPPSSTPTPSTLTPATRIPSTPNPAAVRRPTTRTATTSADPVGPIPTERLMQATPPPRSVPAVSQPQLTSAPTPPSASPMITDTPRQVTFATPPSQQSASSSSSSVSITGTAASSTFSPSLASASGTSGFSLPTPSAASIPSFTPTSTAPPLALASSSSPPSSQSTADVFSRFRSQNARQRTNSNPPAAGQPNPPVPPGAPNPNGPNPPVPPGAPGPGDPAADLGPNNQVFRVLQFVVSELLAEANIAMQINSKFIDGLTNQRGTAIADRQLTLMFLANGRARELRENFNRANNEYLLPPGASQLTAKLAGVANQDLRAQAATLSALQNLTFLTPNGTVAQDKLGQLLTRLVQGNYERTMIMKRILNDYEEDQKGVLAKRSYGLMRDKLRDIATELKGQLVILGDVNDDTASFQRLRAYANNTRRLAALADGVISAEVDEVLAEKSLAREEAKWVDQRWKEVQDAEKARSKAEAEAKSTKKALDQLQAKFATVEPLLNSLSQSTQRLLGSLRPLETEDTKEMNAKIAQIAQLQDEIRLHFDALTHVYFREEKLPKGGLAAFKVEQERDKYKAEKEAKEKAYNEAFELNRTLGEENKALQDKLNETMALWKAVSGELPAAVLVPPGSPERITVEVKDDGKIELPAQAKRVIEEAQALLDKPRRTRFVGKTGIKTVASRTAQSNFGEAWRELRKEVEKSEEDMKVEHRKLSIKLKVLEEELKTAHKSIEELRNQGAQGEQKTNEAVAAGAAQITSFVWEQYAALEILFENLEKKAPQPLTEFPPAQPPLGGPNPPERTPYAVNSQLLEPLSGDKRVIPLMLSSDFPLVLSKFAFAGTVDRVERANAKELVELKQRELYASAHEPIEFYKAFRSTFEARKKTVAAVAKLLKESSEGENKTIANQLASMTRTMQHLAESQDDWNKQIHAYVEGWKKSTESKRYIEAFSRALETLQKAAIAEKQVYAKSMEDLITACGVIDGVPIVFNDLILGLDEETRARYRGSLDSLYMIQRTFHAAKNQYFAVRDSRSFLKSVPIVLSSNMVEIERALKEVETKMDEAKRSDLEKLRDKLEKDRSQLERDKQEVKLQEDRLDDEYKALKKQLSDKDTERDTKLKNWQAFFTEVAAELESAAKVTKALQETLGAEEQKLFDASVGAALGPVPLDRTAATTLQQAAKRICDFRAKILAITSVLGPTTRWLYKGKDEIVAAVVASAAPEEPDLKKLWKEELEEVKQKLEEETLKRKTAEKDKSTAELKSNYNAELAAVYKRFVGVALEMKQSPPAAVYADDPVKVVAYEIERWLTTPDRADETLATLLQQYRTLETNAQNLAAVYLAPSTGSTRKLGEGVKLDEVKKYGEEVEKLFERIKREHESDKMKLEGKLEQLKLMTSMAMEKVKILNAKKLQEMQARNPNDAELRRKFAAEYDSKLALQIARFEAKFVGLRQNFQVKIDETKRAMEARLDFEKKKVKVEEAKAEASATAYASIALAAWRVANRINQMRPEPLPLPVPPPSQNQARHTTPMNGANDQARMEEDKELAPDPADNLYRRFDNMFQQNGGNVVDPVGVLYTTFVATGIEQNPGLVVPAEAKYPDLDSALNADDFKFEFKEGEYQNALTLITGFQTKAEALYKKLTSAIFSKEKANLLVQRYKDKIFELDNAIQKEVLEIRTTFKNQAEELKREAKSMLEKVKQIHESDTKQGQEKIEALKNRFIVFTKLTEAKVKELQEGWKKDREALTRLTKLRNKVRTSDKSGPTQQTEVDDLLETIVDAYYKKQAKDDKADDQGKKEEKKLCDAEAEKAKQTEAVIAALRFWLAKRFGAAPEGLEELKRWVGEWATENIDFAPLVTAIRKLDDNFRAKAPLDAVKKAIELLDNKEAGNEDWEAIRAALRTAKVAVDSMDNKAVAKAVKDRLGSLNTGDANIDAATTRQYALHWRGVLTETRKLQVKFVDGSDLEALISKALAAYHSPQRILASLYDGGGNSRGRGAGGSRATPAPRVRGAAFPDYVAANAGWGVDNAGSDAYDFPIDHTLIAMENYRKHKPSHVDALINFSRILAGKLMGHNGGLVAVVQRTFLELDRVVEISKQVKLELDTEIERTTGQLVTRLAGQVNEQDRVATIQKAMLDFWKNEEPVNHRIALRVAETRKRVLDAFEAEAGEEFYSLQMLFTAHAYASVTSAWVTLQRSTNSPFRSATLWQVMTADKNVVKDFAELCAKEFQISLVEASVCFGFVCERVRECV